jgi:hypothetical protein
MRLRIAFAPNLPRRKGIAHSPAAPASIDAATREALLRAVARARGWMDAILAGRVASFDDVAAAEGLAERHVRRLAPLAFLSPWGLGHRCRDSYYIIFPVPGKQFPDPTNYFPVPPHREFVLTY